MMSFLTCLLDRAHHDNTTTVEVSMQEQHRLVSNQKWCLLNMVQSVMDHVDVVDTVSLMAKLYLTLPKSSLYMNWFVV